MVKEEVEPPVVFFLDESVFRKAGKHLTKRQSEYDPSIEFISSLTFENIGRQSEYRQVLSYTTQQILSSVKEEDYSRKFEDKHLGKPMVYIIPDPNSGGYKKENLIAAAHDKYAEIESDVMIVANNADKEMIEEKINQGDYPMDVGTVEEAIERVEDTDLNIGF